MIPRSDEETLRSDEIALCLIKLLYAERLNSDAFELEEGLKIP